MSKWIKRTWIIVGLTAFLFLIIFYIQNSSNNTEGIEYVDVGWWNIRDFGINSRDDQEAKLVASDHRPVWIRLYIPNKDDD